MPSRLAYYKCKYSTDYPDEKVYQCPNHDKSRADTIIKRRGKVFANKCSQSACINGEVRIPIIPLVSLGYMPQVIKSQFMTLSIVRRVYRMKRSNNGRAKANRIFEFQVSFCHNYADFCAILRIFERKMKNILLFNFALSI